MPIRRHRLTVLVVAVAVLATLGVPAVALPGLPGLPGHQAELQAELVDELAAAGATHEVVAVASTSLPHAVLVPALEAVGLTATPMQELPAVAIAGVPAAITAAGGIVGVDHLWANTPLEQALAQSKAMIGATEVATSPDLGFTGAGVAVAVLDSGIEATHPDLAFGDKTIQNVKILGNQHLVDDVTVAVEDVPDTDTTTGHGTHVAGIVAGDGTASDGLYAGVATGASLVGVGAADGVEMLTALAGYDWILANHDEYGIRVINNSWADGEIAYDPDHPLNVASKAAFDAGIVVVFAAGNGGQASGNVFNRYAWPDWVVSVGGVDKTGELGDYSSRGDATHHADVVAPGTFIASTMATTGIVGVPNQSPLDLTDPFNPRVIAPEHLARYTVKIGTSMAAPHVAGVVAMMLEANPDLTPSEVRDLLIAHARPVAGCAVVDCGAGLVDAVGAVRGALDAAVQAPVAALTVNVSSGAAPLAVTWDASGSTDADGVVVAWEWDEDADGDVDVTTSVPTLDRVLPSGVHRMTVVAVDDDGLRSAPSGVVEVRASDPPHAAASAPTKGKSGQAFTVDASASFDPDGTIVGYELTFDDGTVVTSTSPTIDHTILTCRPVRMGWSLVVTDDTGLVDATTGNIKITPKGGTC